MRRGPRGSSTSRDISATTDGLIQRRRGPRAGPGAAPSEVRPWRRSHPGGSARKCRLAIWSSRAQSPKAEGVVARARPGLSAPGPGAPASETWGMDGGPVCSTPGFALERRRQLQSNGWEQAQALGLRTGFLGGAWGGGGVNRLSACASIPSCLCVAVALAVSKAPT
jgi:hypothetical protein